jgi:hypothetical protein
VVPKLVFDRCYALDDGDDERPAYLSLLFLLRVAALTVLLLMLLIATPFWHGKAAPRPIPTTGAAAQAAPAR